MYNVSRFVMDPATPGEFLACLWQGEVPASLRLDRWIYLDEVPRTILLIWEGDEAARAWIERQFGGFGTLETTSADDATGGLAACLDRDLEGFGEWMRARGSDDAAVAHALDVRRRGLEADSQQAAAAAGRAWMTGA